MPGPAFFGIKVVLPGLARDKLSPAGDFYSFSKCFICFHFDFPTRSIVVERPLGLLVIGSAILYSAGISFKNRSSRSLRKANSIYLYRPHKNKSTLTRCPSASQAAAFLALSCISWSPVPIFTWTLFVSVVWDL